MAIAYANPSGIIAAPVATAGIISPGVVGVAGPLVGGWGVPGVHGVHGLGARVVLG